MASLRTTLRNTFENQKSPAFVITNDILALATLVSVLALVLETVAAFASYQPIFNVIEYATVALFTAEYLGRLYVAKSRFKYAFSFFGIIDLLAILPSFIGMANLTFLKTSRSLRILRFLRILRLAKLARKGKKHPSNSSIYVLNIQIYFTALLTAILIMGSLLYLTEGHHAYAKDLPSAMYWTLSVILGGLSYERPTSTIGVTLLIACRFLGLVFLGLIVSLTGTLMRKVLIGSEKDNE
ncbi:MAG TPA: ion transporter [Candidatus Paceibacterota bacterium]|nr:ion transporter [Candidatus Paceibacterota bacterium]